LAPKAIASELRFRFESKDGLGAVYQSENEALIKSIAQDLGITHLTKTSAKNETLADLFSEQTILCSLLPYGALESFNHLVENGIEPEVAYFECWFEVKLIVDTMIKMGPEKFFEMISPNALIGSEIGRTLFFDEAFKKKLSDCYSNITSGHFDEDVSKIDIDELKKSVKTFWQNEQLNTIHNELSPKLYIR
jgi:ketol-acid reductoisomerase